MTHTLIERILQVVDSASLTGAPRQIRGLERLGTDATAADAEQVLGLAERLATEQGDIDFDAISWLSNRTYDWTELWEAANGNVAALAKVRTEAGLPVLS